MKSTLGPAALCGALGKLDAVAVRTGAVESLEEFELASYLAERSFAKKTNIARKPTYEFLLWLAGKNDIDSAMKELSPREGESEFFVVVFSDAGKTEILRGLDAEEKPLGLKKKCEALRLERISLSRVK